ncbi:uncharacterized conserved protein [Longilinea arvoryzae]|uniref:Uncharacterized conserved protein n=1 Tax=Longilinea arvoryzae TaxID=360412 RepID=A0A0S7BHQ3_9CHLR|nr:hemerythrin domain-containing protein [Longilinea arvoryzae]GAP13361.1 uncharacterized conserved protein [Longilinea arvoryzae]
MKATEILSSEHRIIERVIAALETESDRLASGQAVPPAFFLEAADFIQGFGDGCHHAKEEKVLFKALVANGLPKKNGPVGAMLMEHEQGRVFTRAMRAAAERLQNGDSSAAAEVIQNARGYATLLRQHIQKEDRVLFPMANQVIPADQHADIFERFEAIEEEETGAGVHEKFEALAEKLEQEAGLK